MILKVGSTGNEVKKLQTVLKQKGYIVSIDGKYGPMTKNAVMSFQCDNMLAADGIAGEKTLNLLYNKENNNKSNKIDNNIINIAKKINIEPALLQCVIETETGSVGAFIKDTTKPTILFEGHVFYKRLKEYGLNPDLYINTNTKDILYKTWTKQYYKTGLKEWKRLERARQIHRDAANESASWGLAQIMGFNYKMCNCTDINEFVHKMSESKESQLELFAYFIYNNKNMYNALKNKNWSGFAKLYNGPGYASNSYDKKLQQNYNKYK